MNRMDIYVGARRSGKTATLIKKSAETGAYIVAPSRCMADYIRKQANDMGYDIPEPFSVEEIFRMKQNKPFMNTDIIHGILATCYLCNYPHLTGSEYWCSKMGGKECEYLSKCTSIFIKEGDVFRE